MTELLLMPKEVFSEERQANLKKDMGLADINEQVGAMKLKK